MQPKQHLSDNDLEYLSELVMMPHWGVLLEALKLKENYFTATLITPAEEYPTDFYKKEAQSNQLKGMRDFIHFVQESAKKAQRNEEGG